MKNVAAVLLVAVAIAYYMGYEPWEFIPSWPASNTPPPKVRRAPAAVEQAPAVQPQQVSGSTVVADDGSLANRWKTTPSPGKP